MTTPINLNKYRKTKAREDRKTRAAENAVKFGRTKAERQRDKAENQRSADRLSDHRRDDE